MLLKNIQKKDVLKEHKEKFFQFQYCLMSTQQQSTHLFHFLIWLFSMIPKISLLFREQHFQPNIINKFFRCFLFSGISQILEIQNVLIYSFVIILMVIFILFSIYAYNNQVVNSFSNKTLLIQINFYLYFKVAITQIHYHMIRSYQQNQFSIIFSILAIFTYSFFIVLSVLYLKCNIKPLRKNNNHWRFNNNEQIIHFFLTVFRSLIFLIDGINLKIIILSLALQIIWRLSSKHYQTKFYRINSNTASNCVIATHIGVIVSFVSKDKSLATKLWLCLLIFVIFKGFYDFFNQNTRPLQLPICGSRSFEYYDFYYRILQRIQIKSQLSSYQNYYLSIFKQHARKCQMKSCEIKYICVNPKNILPELQKIVSNLLHGQNNQNPQSEILQQIWNLERGKKIALRNIQQTNIALQFQYILFCINKIEITRGNLISKNGASNIMMNTIFFESINKILIDFYQFYEQILRPQPKLQNLTSLGLSIRQNVQQTQILYKQLLKNKCISFQAIEFFIQFQNSFLNKTSFNSATTKRIIQIQKNVQNDQIQKNQYPSLTVYSQNGLIQNVNMECISLLKLSRFQIKTKNIKDIFYPNFKVEHYDQMTQQHKNNCLIFIKKRNNQYYCGQLKIIKKQQNNKKINIYIFKRQKKLEGQNFIIVDKNFQLFQAISYQQILKDKNDQKIFQTLNWVEIYNKFVKSKNNEIKALNIIRIQIKQFDSYLMCSLNETFNQNYFVLSLKMIKHIKLNTRKQKKRRSTINLIQLDNKSRKQTKNFVFFHHLNVINKACLKGIYKQKQQEDIHKRSRTMNFQLFVGKVRTSLIQKTLLQNKNYDKGIKTYRLYENDLYNIDLENKQAYIESFNDQKIKKYNQQNKNFNFSDTYIIFLVILVAILATGLSIILYFQLDNQITQISQYFVKFNSIDQFTLNFYRILAILRDVASGLYSRLQRDWVEDIIFSYNQLFEDRNDKLFSNEKVRMFYNENLYEGNLNELIQVILSDIYFLTINYEGQVISNIHNTSILQIAEYIENQQINIKNNLQNGLKNINLNTMNILIGITILIILFYFLMVALCITLFSNIKSNLNSIMIISDNQARKKQQNTQKLIYAIQMMKKNYQIDLKSLLLEKKRYKPRKKQKQIIVGLRMKAFIIILIFLFLFSHITIIYSFKNTLLNRTEQFNEMKTQGQNIIGVYSNLCQQTNRIQHTQILKPQKIKQLRNQIKNVQKSRGSFAFHNDTNQAIIDYFFGNSCNRLIDQQYLQKSKGLTCKKSTPGYQIQNPFQLGLAMYFSRVHYNIVDNISDSFASTGVYSFLFARTFRQLSLKITTDGKQKLQNFILISQLWMTIFIIIDILYCIVAILLFLYVKKKIASVDRLIKFLDVKNNSIEAVDPQIQ